MYPEIAKKLKDAGFPQIHGLEGILEDKNNPLTPNYPTLSELIETCGDKFLSLEYIIDGGMDGKERLWWASSRQSIVPEAYQVAGTSMIEAVANLWIEINKK